MPQLKDMISEEEYNKIIEMYKNNISIREISKLTGHGRQGLTRMLEQEKIKTTFGNHYRKYFFNFDFFEKIDNELNAYWLGLLYADGCILSKKEGDYGEQDFKLTVAKQDEEILEKYKEDLKSTYPLRYDNCNHNKNESNQIQVICQYRSQKTVDDLKRLGCIEQKSLILDFPTEEQVPEKFIYHFIRGYFDGDGSISIRENTGQRQIVANISFVGTEKFITKLATYFEGGSIVKDQRKENSWYFNLGGNLQVIKAYHLMYDNATRYLKRKYDKFQILISKYSES